ncbi:GGDEF-domain containing protein, partial [Pseudomonas syringae pv. tagetis]
LVDNCKLVYALINHAQIVKLVVVGEGVVTSGHLVLLRVFGCNQVQGNLIGRALPMEDVETYMR